MDDKLIKKPARFIKKKSVINDECCICLQSLIINTGDIPEYGVVVKLGCGHEFHNGCINNWLETMNRTNLSCPWPKLTCPLCRRIVDYGDAMTIWALQNRCLKDAHRFLTKEYIGETK